MCRMLEEVGIVDICFHALWVVGIESFGAFSCIAILADALFFIDYF